ncbi:hypothetical protein KCU78_g2949, partial [Aureobasidium melanogenum]
MSSHNGPTTQSSEAPASDWSAQSSERPLPDAETGKVMRTIWNWETRVWEHEYEKHDFSWEERQYYPMRKPCSLPPLPISRPPLDATASMVMYTAFDWEKSRWEHGYQCGGWTYFPPGSFASLRSLPSLTDPLLVPPPSPPTRLPSPHPTFGRAISFGFNTYAAMWSVTYEDGTAVPISDAELEQMFPEGVPF